MDLNKRRGRTSRRNSWPVESMRHSARQNGAKNRDVSSGKMASQTDHLGLMVYSAIVNNDINTIKQVFKGHKVQTVDRLGNTALHIAAQTANIVILKWLLKNTSIAIMEKNYKGETCAHTAISKGISSQCLRILKIIVYSGKMKPVVITNEQDNNGMTVLHLATVAGNTNVVCWLVETFGRSLAIMRNNYGQTALHFAAARGYLKIVIFVGKYGKFIANMKDKLGATPVFYAAQEGHLNCLKYLVTSLKGDPHTYTDQLVTPLTVASQCGHLDVVKYLLEICNEEDLMHQCQDGATAFHMASANGHVTVLKLLLTHHSSREAIHIRDLKGSSPAHDAALQSYTECLKLLLEQGLNLHQPNQAGQTPYSLASQSTDPECISYALTLKDDMVHFNPKPKSPFETEVVMCGSRPPESPESSKSRSVERRNHVEDLELPRKKKFRRSADILMRIKAIYSGNKGNNLMSKSDMDSPSSRYSQNCDVFFKENYTTGPKRAYHEMDRQLYHQQNRSVPLALPYVDSDRDAKKHYQKDKRNNISEAEFNSGESGYMSDHAISHQNRYENGHSHLLRARSCDDLNDTDKYHNSPGNSPRKNVQFNILRHKKSRSDDFTLQNKTYLSPQRLVWAESGSKPYNGDQSLQSSERTMQNVGCDQAPTEIDYSKPGASVVLSDNVNENKSFLYSKRNHAGKHANMNGVTQAANMTSSDTDDYPSLPTIQEQVRQTNSNKKSKLNTSEKIGVEPIYSHYIPAYKEHIEYTESIYYDPDTGNNPIVRRKYSMEHNYGHGSPNRRGRKLSKSPPPLPPPRPYSQNIKVPDIDTESMASSIPSDAPPEPQVDYVTDNIQALLTVPAPPPSPPPPPPLPPPQTIMYHGKHGRGKKTKTLADIMQENMMKNKGKMKAPKKPPRRGKKSKQRKQPKKRVSGKIEKIGAILEESGALESLQTRPLSNNRDEDVYSHQIHPYSRSSSWNASPAAGRSISPKEAPQKFSYLPGGVLYKPRLRHIDRYSLRRARVDQVTRRDRAMLNDYGEGTRPSVMTPTGNNLDSIQYHSDSMVPTYGRKSPDFLPYKASEEYNALVDTLKRRMAKRNHLPLPDFHTAKQLEKAENPPSELELYFKQRKQRLEDMDIYHTQHDVLEKIKLT